PGSARRGTSEQLATGWRTVLSIALQCWMPVVVPGGAAAQTGWKMAPWYTSVFSPLAAGLPPTIDDDALAAIKADVADNHVATPEGRDQSELAAIVAEARADGIPLSIVVIPGNPGHDSNLRDLATEVAKTEHGTVRSEERPGGETRTSWRTQHWDKANTAHTHW